MDIKATPKTQAKAQMSIKSFFQALSANNSAPAPHATAPSNNTPSSNRPPPDTPAAPSLPAAANASPPLPSSGLAETPTHHPQAFISPVTPANVQSLKRINSLLLEVSYAESFYAATIAPSTSTSPNLSRVLVWHDTPSPPNTTPPKPIDGKVVGGLVGRIEPSNNNERTFYIQSLALLSPYRSQGLASALIDSVISDILKMPPGPNPITSAYVHVWTKNQDALDWYNRRGFSQAGGVLNGYYRKLKPDTAWILRRKITPNDGLKHGASLASGNQSHGPTQPLNRSGVTSAPPGSKARLLPPEMPRSGSYQTSKPATEWNDLPDDILTKTTSQISLSRKSPLPPTTMPAPAQMSSGNEKGDELPPPSSLGMNLGNSSGDFASGASSRSSSRTRAPGAAGKKKRTYPAAAFAGAGAGKS